MREEAGWELSAQPEATGCQLQSQPSLQSGSPVQAQPPCSSASHSGSRTSWEELKNSRRVLGLYTHTHTHRLSTTLKAIASLNVLTRRPTWAPALIAFILIYSYFFLR